MGLSASRSGAWAASPCSPAGTAWARRQSLRRFASMPRGDVRTCCTSYWTSGRNLHPLSTRITTRSSLRTTLPCFTAGRRYGSGPSRSVRTPARTTSGSRCLRQEIGRPSKNGYWPSSRRRPTCRPPKVVYRKKEKLLPWLPIAPDPRRQRYVRSLQRGLFDEGEVAGHRMRVPGTWTAGQQHARALLGQRGADQGRGHLTEDPAPDGRQHRGRRPVSTRQPT